MRTSAYIPLLAVRAVREQAATGLLAQVSQGAMGVGIILVVRKHTGSLALAGAVVGALSIAAGLARPVQGRLIDARGAAGVMAVCGVVHPTALIAVVAASPVHALRWLLVLPGILAGVSLPPISTTMRAEWGVIVGAGERTAAYSLVYLVQELAILAGPLVLAAVIAVSSSSIAVVVVATLAGAGTLGFAASIRAATSRRGTAPRSERGRVLSTGAMRIVLLISLSLGGVIGGIEVAAPTFATGHGSPAGAGLLIAALSVGGIAGATIYGSGRWRARPSFRLLFLLAVLTLWLVLMVAADGLVVLGLLLLMAGVPLNPALTTLSLLVDRHVRGASAAEAFGWLSTALAGGTGAASAIAAAVTQRHDASAALIVAASAGAAATALTAAARRSL